MFNRILLYNISNNVTTQRMFHLQGLIACRRCMIRVEFRQVPRTKQCHSWSIGEYLERKIRNNRRKKKKEKILGAVQLGNKRPATNARRELAKFIRELAKSMSLAWQFVSDGIRRFVLCTLFKFPSRYCVPMWFVYYHILAFKTVLLRNTGLNLKRSKIAEMLHPIQ